VGGNEANEFWLDAKVTDGNSLAMSDIAAYRYQLDLAGLSGTTWGGLRWKLCSGPSLVFKVDAWAKDWWYDTIEPWKHFIPVKEDLSELHEQWLWDE
jgi:Glycosyl transferase family 90